MSYRRGQDQHRHYDHYRADMAERLDGLYGRVDHRMNDRIGRWLCGNDVLDVGCGFGALVNQLRERGINAIGMDLLEECIAEGRRRFPGADLRVGQPEKIDLPDKSVDTVILKDTLHHIYAESDIQSFLGEVRRVCRSRLIILDPNPMPILLWSRRIIGHVDPTCSPQEARSALVKAGLKIVHESYSDVIAFPLSGGYVGPRLVPSSDLLFDWTLKIDGFSESLLQVLHLSRQCCWRYLLVAAL